MKRLIACLAALLLCLAPIALSEDALDEYGLYTASADVARYIERFGGLPCNYISLTDAASLGWSENMGALSEYAPGFLLGGEPFELNGDLTALPMAGGRLWFWCEVEDGRGAPGDHWLIYSNDGLYYETPDGGKTLRPLPGTPAPVSRLPEDGAYTARDDVALYIHLYGRLPRNFITKDEARGLGWDSSYNYVSDVAPGKSIGGDRFGNYEGALPDARGRSWKECDVGYKGGRRDARRIVYSNDGLIYYTDDHYETFTLLYTKDGAQTAPDREDEAA